MVSKLQIGGEPWAELLLSKESDFVLIEVARARGMKCERCWHFENDIGTSQEHPTLCGRCLDVFKRL